MDYNELSDFEINKLVAESLPFTQVVGEGVHPSESESAVHIERKMFKYGNIEECGADYCNNPSDAWPIVEEIWGTLMSLALYDYQVGLGAVQTTIWEARTHMHNGNKLRAAMIVYLMMQEGA